jgi:excinuclease ABC subunit C
MTAEADVDEQEKKIRELKSDLDLVPERPGVYLFRNRAGAVIYVGKANSLRNRLRSYFQERGQPYKTQRLIAEAARFECLVTDTEAEALVLECNLIKEYRPKFNIDLKDDKSYPFIRVTAEEFPRVMVTRRLVRDGSRYFGPYPDVGAVRETLGFLRRMFPFRSCSGQALNPRSRPCLNAQIGQCLAPCAGQVSPESYREMIENLVLFLEGKRRQVERSLASRMEQAARAMDFEQAARLRNQLAALKCFNEQQRVARASGSDEDLLAAGTYLDEVCVLVLRVRGGKLVAEENYFLAGAEEMKPGEILASFIKQYYHAGREIPSALLVSSPLPESELLGKWLGGLRGRKVQIHTPSRGRGRQLLNLAVDNAHLYAERHHRQALRTREKGRTLVFELQGALGLARPPRRLECVDISHFGGRETVGSLVRFTDGRPDTAGYRRYRIRNAPPGDDYAALQEVLRRRLAQAERAGRVISDGVGASAAGASTGACLPAGQRAPLPEGARYDGYALPDLLVIDGGKGQLHAVLEVLGEANAAGRDGIAGMEVASLAKEEEQVFLPGRPEPLVLPRNNAGLHLLQQARDEAHRFAHAYQEKLRRDQARTTVIAQAPGIGKRRQRALLKQFGSLARLRAATMEELAAVPGMNRKAAADLHAFLRGQ